MPTLNSTSNCACASLRRANRAVCHLYDLVLAPERIKSSQYIILQTIAEAGEIAHCDLARTLAASEETLSRRLASASKAGWVKMRIGERNRRIYSITEHGRALLDRAAPYWERAEERLRHALGDVSWREVTSFAERISDAAVRAESAPVRNSRPHPAA